MTVCFRREKKKEQERDELWKKLDQFKLGNAPLVQNNSHSIPSVQNNNNNNNSNNESQEATSTPSDKDLAVTVEVEDSTPCAKWQ